MSKSDPLCRSLSLTALSLLKGVVKKYVGFLGFCCWGCCGMALNPFGMFYRMLRPLFWAGFFDASSFLFLK